ncbi:DUF2958 domain-containing protein [Mesorhizobium sp. BR1-1-7]|uniref:DUF2958 domain-containing protein n=1 Tax=Mesorhizobium sp. BR1-1-7 TaxID=2876647 RepID=UPI001CCE1BE9|nr:DUF2958 domain-containing protein [Mesorhizobium sp. BR1-1-7]MBZ9921385.1 DUF2958 domain-containing protein [Mesorhizobium sp. BR1-1-7]
MATASPRQWTSSSIDRLAAEPDEDRDPCSALANLGKPELGSVVIVDITAVRFPAGLGMEPDVLFEDPASRLCVAASRLWERQHPRGSQAAT